MINSFLHNSHLVRIFRPALAYTFPLHTKFSSNVNQEVVSSDDNLDISYSVFQSDINVDDSKKEKVFARPLGKYRYTRKYLIPQAERTKSRSRSRRNRDSSDNKLGDLAMNPETHHYPGIPRLKNENAVRIPNDGVASRIRFEEKKDVELNEDLKNQIPPSSFEKAKKYQNFLKFVSDKRSEFKHATTPAFMNVVTVGENTFNCEKIPPNRRIGEIDTFALSYNHLFEVPVKRNALVIDNGEFECKDSINEWSNSKNVNKYIYLSENEKNFCGEYKDEFLLSGGKRVMLRSCIQKLLKKIQNYENGELTNLPEFLIINGPRGSGKSFCLNTVIDYCLKKDWIVLFSNSIYDVCNNGSNVIPSRRSDNTFDIFDYSTEILNNFISIHGDKLKKCLVRGEYKDGYWRSGSDFSNKLKSGNATLYDMVKHGIDKYRDSGDILYHLRDELSEVEEFPVLVCADEYNLIYDKTVYQFAKLPVYGFQLRYNQAFEEFDIDGNIMHKPIKNGLSIYSTTQKYPLRSNIEFDYSKYEVNIPYYNKNELSNVLSYYVKSGGLKGNISEGDFQRMFMISQGCGKIVRDICLRDLTSFFIHYS